jgi:hypothetical protein
MLCIGWASRDFTPTRPALLMGQMHVRTAREAADPLTVTALALVVQLAAGLGWYLPTARAIEGGHYGAHPVVAPIGAEGGQELVEATLALAAGLFPAA